VYAQNVLAAAPASATDTGMFLFDPQTTLGIPFTLLSTSDVLAINFGGVALPAGLQVSAFVVWCESSKS
jgi:hypothetical protein